MKVAIIKYNAGNVFSVDFALRRLGIQATITDDLEFIKSADRVVFPGVGEAAYTMQNLRSTGLDSVICGLQQPVLGICLGMQLMCRHSEEGDVDTLGIFDAEVLRFNSNGRDKVPQMGWNNLTDMSSPLMSGLYDPYVYFVHSYYVPICKQTIATCDYIEPFSAALHQDNFYATQFHPEKSGSVGEIILQNFLSL